MALTSMKMSKKEAKKQTQGPTIAESQQYPYGLSISLDNDALEKLSVGAGLEVGDEVAIVAKAKVTSKSGYETMVGVAENSVCLQITDMEVTGGSSKTAKTLYDGK
jgi:hypothetical protein